MNSLNSPPTDILLARRRETTKTLRKEALTYLPLYTSRANICNRLGWNYGTWKVMPEGSTSRLRWQIRVGLEEVRKLALNQLERTSPSQQLGHPTTEENHTLVLSFRT
jgi:hypothetical protein